MVELKYNPREQPGVQQCSRKEAASQGNCWSPPHPACQMCGKRTTVTTAISSHTFTVFQFPLAIPLQGCRWSPASPNPELYLDEERLQTSLAFARHSWTPPGVQSPAENWEVPPGSSLGRTCTSSGGVRHGRHTQCKTTTLPNRKTTETWGGLKEGSTPQGNQRQLMG